VQFLPQQIAQRLMGDLAHHGVAEDIGKLGRRRVDDDQPDLADTFQLARHVTWIDCARIGAEQPGDVEPAADHARHL
jgi:hypothetical protein